ncbi:uncharacterized protein N7525_002172 [Penicillium rubens]|uniref:uncharacterized protein n=1 Tax=Penicillium rubens TaxID=1108849 RepID=UPI002A5A171E|nr:uncharacterized protein N7525_002172 [Penicillium rubens]KAJ5844431.1 hypothetical protein N7525_002172 [Penicillium rubens]
MIQSNSFDQSLQLLSRSWLTKPSGRRYFLAIEAPYVLDQPAFLASVVQLSDDMKSTILAGYDDDSRWKSLIETLIDMEASQDPILVMV